MIIVSCSGKQKKESLLFPDTWHWRSEDRNQEFTIKIIKITKDSLLAQYCAVQNNGQKLDCDFDKNINIKATFDKNKNAYTGSFHSFFKSGEGTCLIRITDKSLTWQIVKIPAGEFYAPTRCILNKKRETAKDQKNVSDSLVSLPFDYEEYEKTCIQQGTSDCQKRYPTLNKAKYDKIIKITGITEGSPESVFHVESTLGNHINIYILNFEGDSGSQEMITVNHNKIISRQSIGYAMPEEETYETFIINPDMTVTIFEVSFTDPSKKKEKEKYKIAADGHISKI